MLCSKAHGITLTRSSPEGWCGHPNDSCRCEFIRNFPRVPFCPIYKAHTPQDRFRGLGNGATKFCNFELRNKLLTRLQFCARTGNHFMIS
jgi:hypothetical protein